MYARVSTAEVQPGRTDEVVAVSRDSVLPAAQQQQGFEGGLWLTDPDTVLPLLRIVVLGIF